MASLFYDLKFFSIVFTLVIIITIDYFYTARFTETVIRSRFLPLIVCWCAMFRALGRFSLSSSDKSDHLLSRASTMQNMATRLGAAPGFPLQRKRESTVSLICPATSIKYLVGTARLQENRGRSAEPEARAIASPFWPTSMIAGPF